MTLSHTHKLGAAIYHDQGIYHGFTGPVRTTDEGAAIAKALGNKSIVIAKNHGLFTTGNRIQAALWDMVIADTAAKIHLSAKQLGLQLAAEILSEKNIWKRVKLKYSTDNVILCWQAIFN